MPLTKLDLSMVLEWRNASEVRRNMYTQHVITQEEHFNWFERIQDNDQERWCLWYDSNGEPMGIVNFKGIDQQHQRAFWGFYAKPKAGAGIGYRMELDALDLSFGELALHKLNCEVLSSNMAVVNLHKKVGFKEEGIFREQYFDGEQRIDIVRLGMLSSEWPQYRDPLCRRIEKLDLRTQVKMK